MSSPASSPASTPSSAPRALLHQHGMATKPFNSSSGGRRQRVLWDSDSATRGGKTSIAILLEWLTAPGNYTRWRDGKSQTGETREALCSKIKSTMRQNGIHHRENANIRTQISELERSFDAARNWIKENNLDPYTFRRGADVEDDHGVIEVDGARAPVEAHVLRMCRYYHTLNEVFGHDEDRGLRQRRTYHQKTLTHGVPIRKRKLPGGEVHEVEPKIMTETVEEKRVLPDSVQLPSATVAAIAPAVSAAVSTPVSAAVPIASTAGLAGTWANPAALESTQRMLAEAVREERERKRFCMEEERNKLECEKLRYEVEAAKLKLTIDRALARKKLLDAGLPEPQVDELFPK
ncbi:hypothetical protein PI124_g7442 [Phytophthora idaei]|nr:hypothetical protein PI125_g11866 [Phytophthora idaei]KAG3151394.1 hypothetical protein PI126_g11030 [Phytophthora idaei]KAG3247871.1 hypothetical protein PI124_g7442 [Phytophthora idaei]